MYKKHVTICIFIKDIYDVLSKYLSIFIYFWFKTYYEIYFA